MYDEIDYCATCKHYDCEPHFEPCVSCKTKYDGPPTKYSAKKRTNADRIRAMSDEELAKECVRQFPMYLWPTEVRTIYFDFEKPNKNNAINAWIEWLKQPAEETT